MNRLSADDISQNNRCLPDVCYVIKKDSRTTQPLTFGNGRRKSAVEGVKEVTSNTILVNWGNQMHTAWGEKELRCSYFPYCPLFTSNDWLSSVLFFSPFYYEYIIQNYRSKPNHTAADSELQQQQQTGYGCIKVSNDQQQPPFGSQM